MSLTDMIVKPRRNPDGSLLRYTVLRGSREFVILRGHRGAWQTYDRSEVLNTAFDTIPCLDVSDDLSGSLEYIESLFT